MLQLPKQSRLNLRTLNTVSRTRRNRLTGTSTTLEAKVMLASGTLTISGNVKATPKLLEKWGNTLHLKGNATIDLGGQTLVINNAKGGSLTGLKFKNGGVAINNSDNFTLKNNSVTNSLTTKNVRAFAVRGSSNAKIIGNKASGRLLSGLNVNGGSNQQISGNNFNRASGTPGAGNNEGNNPLGEDHGIYVLNTKGTIVTGNTARGWSTKPSGHGLKFKDTVNFTATGNDFGSIIGRNVNLNYNVPRGQGKLNVEQTNKPGPGAVNGKAPKELQEMAKQNGITDRGEKKVDDNKKAGGTKKTGTKKTGTKKTGTKKTGTKKTGNKKTGHKKR
jgi:hypothetical protein